VIRIGPASALRVAMTVVTLVARCAHAQPQPTAWPARVDLAGAHAIVFEYEGSYTRWRAGTVVEGWEPTLPGDRERADRFREASGLRVPLRYERAGAYVIDPTPAEGKSDGSRYGVVWSARPAESGADLSRTWFRATDPEGEPRGLAVLMPGMLGTPEPFVDRVERALLLDGWAVLRMLAPPSRVTERYTATIDLSQESMPGLDELTSELDQRAADAAYAVQAVLRYSAGTAPGLPRVIIGMSGTAVLLPTAVAANPGAFSAAVLIAGGADSLRIARESTYAGLIDAVRFEFAPPEPDDAALEALSDAYLARSVLDAYSTAGALAGIPVLMIHGTEDRAVPAAAGELLWERLGRPERWSMGVGHELLFLRATLRLSELIEWIDAAVKAQSDGASP
jgi:pimeloyl-ACP methyl ester carboxylesterase